MKHYTIHARRDLRHLSRQDDIRGTINADRKRFVL